MDVKPVAWLHTLHMELGQTDNILSDCDDPRQAHGLPGRDYSEEYTVTTTPLYTQATLAERDAVIAEMRDILLAVKAETRGEPVGGGDGGTYVVRPISGATYNRIAAALQERRT